MPAHGKPHVDASLNSSIDKKTSNEQKSYVEDVARDIYKNYPEILKALGL